jgi:hypothetical protein
LNCLVNIRSVQTYPDGQFSIGANTVFGQLKNSGFRVFSVRGKEKVAGEFLLVCATHNIKKMVKAIVTGVVRLKFSHLAVIA